jgi:hypothetical protein
LGVPGERRRRRRLLALVLVIAGSPLTLSLPLVAQGPNEPTRSRLLPPIDLGLLGPPGRNAWQQPDRAMDALGVADGSAMADIGVGTDWFTVRLDESERVAQSIVEADVASAGLTLQPARQYLRYQYLVIVTVQDSAVQ